MMIKRIDYCMFDLFLIKYNKW